MNNDNYKAQCKRGSEYLTKGEFSHAVEAYTAALGFKPNDHEALFCRGLAYTEVDDFDNAIKDFTTLLKVKPSYDIIAYYHRGIAHANKGNVRKAIKDFTEVLKINDENDEAYVHRGEAYYRSGDFKRAVADWNRALQINPDHATAMKNIESIRKERREQANNETDSAADGKQLLLDFDWTSAEMSDTKITRPDFHKAIELHNDRKYEEALKLYTKVLTECYNHVSARNNRACVYDDLGMYKEAIDDLNITIELSPAYDDAYCNRAYVNIKIKLYEDALDDYRTAISIRHPAYDERELVTLVNGDQLDEGVAALQKLLKSGFYARVSGDIKEKIIIMPRICEYRMVLPLNKLHIGKTIRRHLRQHGNRYELRYDSDFSAIFDRCRDHYDKPDDSWFFEPLQYLLTCLNQCAASPRAVGVALYKDGKLAAGEIGVQIGRVYTSYTGFKDESSAGTAQLILLGQYLIKNGYTLWDLGPSIPGRWDAYKMRLGAKKMPEEKYLSLFEKTNP